MRVRERAIEGRANEAARQAIARALDRSRSAVTLIRDATARRKTFRIEGMTKEDAIRRLMASLA